MSDSTEPVIGLIHFFRMTLVMLANHQEEVERGRPVGHHLLTMVTLHHVDVLILVLMMNQDPSQLKCTEHEYRFYRHEPT